MSFFTFLGSFPQVAFILTLSFACALVLAFVLLRFIVKLITREQYNVTDEPRRIRAIVMAAPALSGGGAIDAGRSGATSGPYLLPAAAPRNRFARLPKPDAAATAGIIQLSQRAGAGTAQGGTGGGPHAARNGNAGGPFRKNPGGGFCC